MEQPPPSEPLMDVLFASQSTSENQKILVHPDGRGYNIHLQVNGMLQRPNLVRLMRRAGANPSRPEDADIILVDSSQLDGKRLIQTWHQAQGKAVLEYQWLRKSVDAGKPLLEGDGWAGAQAIDDGQPIVIDEIADDGEDAEVDRLVSKSPLPTPRTTPGESFEHRKLDVPPTLPPDIPLTLHDPMSYQLPRQSPLVNIPQQHPEHTAQSTYHHAPSISPPLQTSHTPQPISLPPQFIPALSYNSPPQTQLAQSVTQAPFSQPQFPQAHQFQFPQAAPFPQQFAIPQQSYQFGQFPTQQVPPGQLPLMPRPMMVHTGMPYNNLADQQSYSMLMTFMDVLRNKNGGEFLQAGQPSPTHAQLEVTSSAPAPINHERTPDSVFATDQPYPPSSSSYRSRTRTPEVVVSKRPEKGPRPSARKPYSNIFSRSPSRDLLPPSVKRKVNHDAFPPVVKMPKNPPNKRSSKGKERAVTPDDSASDEDVPAGPDDLSEQSPPSPHGRRMTTISANQNPAEVFLDAQGRPLSFFVQVDLQGRSGVVSNIKKHKGKITGSIADADYVILFTRSQTFQGLLSEAQACDKVPVQSAFVADCISEKALLDERDYTVDTGVSTKHLRRGRQGAYVELTEVETLPSVKNETQKPLLDGKPKPTKAKKITSTEAPTRKVTKNLASTSSKISAAPSSHEAKSSRTRRSPTPPPPETRKPMKDGKFFFTPLELDYFCRYARFLLDEDPTMTTIGLLQAVHEKMPHHSVGSWQAQISSKLKPQFTDIRKRANIEHRKGLARKIEKPAGEERPGPSKKPRLASNVNKPTGEERRPGSSNKPRLVASPTAHTQSKEALEREDFEVICQYFAKGGGDDDNDERVWARLSQHRPCKSAKSWPDYYMAHQSEVYGHIEELIQSVDKS